MTQEGKSPGQSVQNQVNSGSNALGSKISVYKPLTIKEGHDKKSKELDHTEYKD